MNFINCSLKKNFFTFFKKKKKTLWSLFMDGVQLPQGYSHFEEGVYFLPFSSQKFWLFYRPQKDERLSRPWSHPVVLNTGPLDWESSALTTRPLLHSFNFQLQKNLFLEIKKYKWGGRP